MHQMRQESGPSNLLDDNDNDTDNQERIQAVPLQCPFPDCDDIMPEKPRGTLARLIKNRQNIIRVSGSKRTRDDQHNLNRIDLLICAEISKEDEYEQLMASATNAGWPSTCNFKRLPRRICDMKVELDQLISHEYAQSQCQVWKVFLKDVKDLVRFVRDSNFQSHHLDKTRPG
jgi:hypothetical protein